ncbi:MAG: DMT family transporter [Bacteroidales bacterium]|jgi:drug/metabolite transporter (DMT)-like permease|nr:DMT family transporter [Bacteroidales bacterium]
MIIPDKVKGYGFAFLATLSMANVYVFSKAALNELNLFQFGFYWFGLAIIWNVLYAVPSGKWKIIKRLGRKEYRILLILGIVELFGTILFFLSIETADDPAIMSFLQNLVPLFVILMGVSFLGERFTILQFSGMLITLLGAAVTSFTGNIAEKGFFVPGTVYMLASTIFLATTMIISKKYIKNLDPGLLATNRSVYLFITALILMLARGESFSLSGSAIFNLGFGSLIGPFLTAFSMYSALQYIEASKSTIIQSSKGIFVTIGAWMYFKTIPESFQVVGGIITIIGVIILISARDYQRKDAGAPSPAGEPVQASRAGSVETK